MSRAGREGAEPSRILKYLSKALDLQTCSSGGRKANRSLSSGIWRGLQPATGGVSGNVWAEGRLLSKSSVEFPDLRVSPPFFFFNSLHVSCCRPRGIFLSRHVC